MVKIGFRLQNLHALVTYAIIGAFLKFTDIYRNKEWCHYWTDCNELHPKGYSNVRQSVLWTFLLSINPLVVISMQQGVG